MIDREKNEGNELKDNMSVSGQNEINFSDLEMQKTGFYYNQQQSFNSYYPAENGYCFDGVHNNGGSYGEPSPSPPGGDYFPAGQQCGMPVGSNPVQNGDMSPNQYGEQYSSQCVQNIACNQNMGSPSPSAGSMKKEIYPWMKESRQNNKRQQQQQQQTQQQQSQTQQQQPQQQQQQQPTAAAQSQPTTQPSQQSPTQPQSLGGKS